MLKVMIVIDDVGSDALAIRTFGLRIILSYVLEGEQELLPTRHGIYVQSTATILASCYANALK